MRSSGLNFTLCRTVRSLQHRYHKNNCRVTETQLQTYAHRNNTWRETIATDESSEKLLGALAEPYETEMLFGPAGEDKPLETWEEEIEAACAEIQHLKGRIGAYDTLTLFARATSKSRLKDDKDNEMSVWASVKENEKFRVAKD